MRTTTATLTCLFLTALTTAPAVAQLVGAFGDERAGTTSMTFLKIEIGGRAVGLGGAYVGVEGDASSLWWNPAAAGLDRQPQVVLNHVEWPADIKYEYIGVKYPLGREHTIGVALANLHMDDMPVTTMYYPGGDGTWCSYSDELYQLSWAVNLTDHFTGGISLKYVREQLDDVVMATPLLDFGTFYYTGYRDLTLAMSITNFGDVMRPRGNYEYIEEDGGTSSRRYKSFSPPTVFRLGSSMHVWHYRTESREVASLLAAIQVTHPVDNRENYNFGLELEIYRRLQLRCGYKSNAGEQSWTTGVGTSLETDAFSLNLDWSYGAFGLLGNTQHMSLVIGF